MDDIDTKLDELLDGLPALPVVTVHDVDSAVTLARTLSDAGLHVIEVTLRTPVALEAIRAMTASVDDLVVGAGTVATGRDLEQACEAGAAFAVSPGATAALYATAAGADLPLLPGVATASDILRGMEAGWQRFKFFPAEAAGGVAALKAFSGPFGPVRFCPTGGVSADNAADYHRLDNVMTVGGSWMVPADAVDSGDWPRIEALARDCVNLLAQD